MQLNRSMSAATSAMSMGSETISPELLNLLIVDDERAVREGCREAGEALGFQTHVAEHAEGAYRLLESYGIDVVLLDLRLPGASGIEVLKEIRRRRPSAQVIVITSYATVQSAVQAMRYGAYDYVTKPFNLDELRLLLERVAGHVKLATENRVLRQKVKSKEGFGNIIGRSPEMEKLYRFICKAASSAHPVLITGESGTGKELVARSIHFSGPYRDNPFIPVDCGSLVPTLIERKQDIPLLVGHFLERLARVTSSNRSVSDDALRIMLNYDWPGNIREMENCLERASALSSGPVLHSADLPSALQNATAMASALSSPGMRRITAIAELEKRAIMEALLQLNRDKLEAARQLGIGKTTLYRKLKEYRLAEFADGYSA